MGKQEANKGTTFNAIVNGVWVDKEVLPAAVQMTREKKTQLHRKNNNRYLT